MFRWPRSRLGKAPEDRCFFISLASTAYIVDSALFIKNLPRDWINGDRAHIPPIRTSPPSAPDVSVLFHKWKRTDLIVTWSEITLADILVATFRPALIIQAALKLLNRNQGGTVVLFFAGTATIVLALLATILPALSALIMTAGSGPAEP